MGTIGRRLMTSCLVIALGCLMLQPMAVRAAATDEKAAAPQKPEDETKKKKKEKKEEEEKKKGTLGTFEAEATKPDSARSTVTVDSEESGESLSWWIYPIAIFGAGVVGSWYRVTGSPADGTFEGWDVRQTGEPTIPFVGLSVSYQIVESDVDGYDARAEGGFGPIAASYRFTRFAEKDPDTELDLSWLHGVLRLSYTRYVEVGLGFGKIFLKGTGSESGFSFTLPLRIEPSEYVGFECRPTWGWINGNTVSDYDLTLRLGVRYVSIRGGYRWTTVGSSTLKGPTVGLLVSDGASPKPKAASWLNSSNSLDQAGKIARSKLVIARRSSSLGDEEATRRTDQVGGLFQPGHIRGTG